MLRHVTLALLVVAGPLAAAGGSPDAPENSIILLQILESAAVPGREAGIVGASATVAGAPAPMAVSGPGGVLALAFTQTEFPVSLVISHPLYRDLPTTVEFDGQLDHLFPDNQRELERRVGRLDVTVTGPAGPVAGAAVEAVGTATKATGGCTTGDAGTCSMELLWDVYELTAEGTTESRGVVLPDQTTSAVLVSAPAEACDPSLAQSCLDLICDTLEAQVPDCPPACDPSNPAQCPLPCDPTAATTCLDIVCDAVQAQVPDCPPACDPSNPAQCPLPCDPTAATTCLDIVCDAVQAQVPDCPPACDPGNPAQCPLPCDPANAGDCTPCDPTAATTCLDIVCDAVQAQVPDCPPACDPGNPAQCPLPCDPSAGPACIEKVCTTAMQPPDCTGDTCDPADHQTCIDFVCTTAGQGAGCLDDICDTSAPAGCVPPPPSGTCNAEYGVCGAGDSSHLHAIGVRTHFVSAGGAAEGKGPTGRWLIATPVLGPPIEALQGDARDHVDLDVATADGTWRILFQPFGAGTVFHAYRIELVFEDGDSCWSPVIERPMATYASAPWAAPWVVNAHIPDGDLGCESFVAEPQPQPNGPLTGNPQALSHARYFGGA